MGSKFNSLMFNQFNPYFWGDEHDTLMNDFLFGCETTFCNFGHLVRLRKILVEELSENQSGNSSPKIPDLGSVAIRQWG